MFHSVKLILFFGVLFWQFFSFGEFSTHFAANDQKKIKETSFETLKEEQNFQSQIEASSLSIKIDLANFSTFVSLEFQIPFMGSENLKMVASMGGGGGFSTDFKKFSLALLPETGLKYEFQPWTASLALAVFIPTTIKSELMKSRTGTTYYKKSTILPYLKLSAGRNIGNVHIALTTGITVNVFSLISFFGLSVGFPIYKW